MLRFKLLTTFFLLFLNLYEQLKRTCGAVFAESGPLQRSWTEHQDFLSGFSALTGTRNDFREFLQIARPAKNPPESQSVSLKTASPSRNYRPSIPAENLPISHL